MPVADYRNLVIQDTVSCIFTVEDRIVSDTVKVTLHIVTAGLDESFNIKETLKLLFDVEWTIVSLQRYEDSSGLERIDALVTARIPELDSAGINKKVSEASKAGLRITVENLDHSPARNIVEQTKENLRTRIYGLAQNEADLLNENVTKLNKSQWRVGNINFTSDSNNQRMGMAAPSANYASMTPQSMESAESIDLSFKVSVSASVTLQRLINV